MNIWYLAGPMSGIPSSNLPAFMAATSALRRNEFIIVSPAEQDGPEVVAKVLRDPDATLDAVARMSWGEALARDVRLISDRCDGIIFLDGWENSKGARLEAFTGVLKSLDAPFHFARYIHGGNIEGMTTHMVLTKLMRYTSGDLRNA